MGVLPSNTSNKFRFSDVWLICYRQACLSSSARTSIGACACGAGARTLLTSIIPHLLNLVSELCLHAGFDAEYLLHHEGRLRSRIAVIEQEAARLVGNPINLASASQLSVALYDTLALPAPRNRSDRSAIHSTASAYSLQTCLGSVCQEAEDLLVLVADAHDNNKMMK